MFRHHGRCTALAVFPNFCSFSNGSDVPWPAYISWGPSMAVSGRTGTTVCGIPSHKAISCAPPSLEAEGALARQTTEYGLPSSYGKLLGLQVQLGCGPRTLPRIAALTSIHFHLNSWSEAYRPPSCSLHLCLNANRSYLSSMTDETSPYVLVEWKPTCDWWQRITFCPGLHTSFQICTTFILD